MIGYKVRLHLFGLLVLLLAHTVQAQENSAPEKWYWAWREDTGELLAYTADGEVNVLADNVIAYRLRRIDDDKALVVVGDTDSYAYYEVTSNTITRLTEEFSGNLDEYETIGQFGYRVLSARPPYVIARLAPTDQRLWIINLEKHLLEAIEVDGAIRFSQDGRFLRYEAALDQERSDILWSIRERDLATGQEVMLYEQLNPEPNAEPYVSFDCEADLYGERWLCKIHAQYDREEVTAFKLIYRDGTEAQIVESTINQPRRWEVHFSGNDLMRVDYECEKYCAIEVFPHESSEPIIYTVPDEFMQSIYSVGLRILEVRRLDNKRIAVFTNDSVHVFEDGNWRVLGYYNCCHAYDNRFYDGRWLSLLNDRLTDATASLLWDVVEEQVILSTKESSGTVFVDNGFFNFDWEANFQTGGWAYSFVDTIAMKLPADENGRFFDILPGQTILYEQIRDGETLSAGIYTYDAARQKFNLLISNARSLDWDF